MEKNMLLNAVGNKQVKDVAGILHLYTPSGTAKEHEDLEEAIQKYSNFKVLDALPFMEDLLDFS